MATINAIFYVIILIMSVVIHEVSHGYAAYRYGDLTAYHAGRLTLNPLKHLELFGSILLPFVLIVSHAGFVFGWAKPVPYNPANLKDKKRGTIAVAVAGVVANCLLAILFGLFIRLMPHIGLTSESLYAIASTIVFVNIVLAIFNLVPIPPLDGSRILFAFLPARYRHLERTLEAYGIFIIIFFILFLWKFLGPAMVFLFHFFTGLPVG